MPRYHFNVYDGVSIVDRDGTQLPDLESAQREAVGLLGALLEADADKMRFGKAWHMEVTNSEGLMLFRLDFKLTTFPLDASIP